MKKLFLTTLLILLSFTLVACGDNNQVSSDDESSTTGQAISQGEAENIAIKKVPGTIIETTVGEEGGKQVYEVLIQTKTNKQQVKVDTVSGEIVHIDTDVDYDGDIDDDVEHEG